MGLFDLGGTPGVGGQPGTDLGSLLSLKNLGMVGLGGLAGAVPTPTSGSGFTHSTSTLDTLSQLLASLTGQQQTTVSPDIQALISKVAGISGNQLANATDLRPYAAQQTEGINQQAQAQSKAVDNIMASRGLSTSPVSATSAANIEAQRQGQITNLNQSLPLLQAQLAQQAIGGANTTIGTAPKGTQTIQQQTQSGNTNQTGTQDTSTGFSQKSGGGIGGLAGGLGSMLATLFA